MRIFMDIVRNCSVRKTENMGIIFTITGMVTNFIYFVH